MFSEHMHSKIKIDLNIGEMLLRLLPFDD